MSQYYRADDSNLPLPIEFVNMQMYYETPLSYIDYIRHPAIVIATIEAYRNAKNRGLSQRYEDEKRKSQHKERLAKIKGMMGQK